MKKLHVIEPSSPIIFGNPYPLKECGKCGAKHYGVPETARYFVDEHLGGWYFECGATCHTTFFVPENARAA